MTYFAGIPQQTAIYFFLHFQYIENRVDYIEQRTAIDNANLAYVVDNARLSLLFSLTRSPLLAGKTLGQPAC